MGFFSAHFDFGNLSEKVKLWYNGSSDVCHSKEQTLNQTEADQHKGSSAKANLIFYGRCIKVQYAAFEGLTGTIASFSSPTLNEKPRVVHLNCMLIAHYLSGFIDATPETWNRTVAEVKKGLEITYRIS